MELHITLVQSHFILYAPITRQQSPDNSSIVYQNKLTMHAILRKTNLVLCFVLAQCLLLHIADASLVSLKPEITNESTTTDMAVLTSTEKELLMATISSEFTTSKSVSTTTEQIMTSTNSSSIGHTTPNSSTIAPDTTTTKEDERFSTTKFDYDDSVKDNELTSSSTYEDSRFEVRIFFNNIFFGLVLMIIYIYRYSLKE